MKNVPFLMKIRPYFWIIGIVMIVAGSIGPSIGAALADTGDTGTIVGNIIFAMGASWMFIGALLVIADIYFRFFYKSSEVNVEHPSEPLPQGVVESVSEKSQGVGSLPAVIDATQKDGAYSQAVESEQKTVGARVKFGGAGCLRLILFSLGIVSCALASLGLAMTEDFVAVGYVLTFLFLGLAGLFFWLFWKGRSAKRVLFPNVSEAERAITVGEIPVDEVVDGLNAREPGGVEEGLMASAIQALDTLPKYQFSNWYVVRSSLPITYAFGDNLFVSREALESDDLPYILAHELGHLNNGDSFVKSAIWSLGKGLFGQENLSLFGTVADDDKEGEFDSNELVGLGMELARQDWIGALAQAASTAAVSSGQGVKTNFSDIQRYFKKWDIEADKFAVKLVDPDEYLRYIGEIEQFERGTGEGPFNAAAVHRYDAVESVIEHQIAGDGDYGSAAVSASALGEDGIVPAEMLSYPLDQFRQMGRFDLVIKVENQGLTKREFNQLMRENDMTTLLI